MTTRIELLNDSTTFIDVDPDFEVEDNESINILYEQTLTGRASSFNYGTNRSFNLPFSAINNSEAEKVNDWWHSQSDLKLTLDLSNSSDNLNVRITNREQPFSRLRKPYFDVFVGNINLTAI